ncbi:hypothetical protein [Streptomyces sp. NPDC101206]|uniref:hypothetical protein n=1 Tax=Streptomyces sp. NPDC101206 TaxID=3366128 RepID=UPI00382A26C1
MEREPYEGLLSMTPEQQMKAMGLTPHPETGTYPSEPGTPLDEPEAEAYEAEHTTEGESHEDLLSMTPEQQMKVMGLTPQPETGTYPSEAGDSPVEPEMAAYEAERTKRRASNRPCECR